MGNDVLPEVGNTAPVPRKALRYPEAAASIGISERMLSQLVKDGHGPPTVQLGKKLVLFPVRELQDWLSGRVRKSPVPSGTS